MNDSASERLVIISDLHIGDPETRLEDFCQDEYFYRFLNAYIKAELSSPVTLIMNGDFIDFAQVYPELGRHALGKRFGCLESESLRKLECVMRGHSLVFRALTNFLAAGNRVVMIAGNHDIDLHWLQVQARLRIELGGGDLLQFSLPSWTTAGVHVEHGNQYSFDNRFQNWKEPFLDAPDGRRLERPWGTYFMDSVYNELEDAYPFINKIFPHAEYAWIVARSFWDKDNVSPGLIAKLVQFLVTDGKTMLAGRLLGDQRPAVVSAGGPPSMLSRPSQADVLRALGVDRPNSRIAAILQEMEPTAVGPDPAGKLLGKTDDVGQRARARELYGMGRDVVVFGHTHRMVDGNVNAVPDAPRVFNSGTWIHGALIDDSMGKLHWRDLNSLPMEPRRHAVLIESGNARLWPLPTDL